MPLSWRPDYCAIPCRHGPQLLHGMACIVIGVMYQVAVGIVYLFHSWI